MPNGIKPGGMPLAEQLAWTGGQVLGGWGPEGIPGLAGEEYEAYRAEAPGLPPALWWTLDMPRWLDGEGNVIIEIPMGYTKGWGARGEQVSKVTQPISLNKIQAYLEAHPEHTHLATSPENLIAMDYATDMWRARTDLPEGARPVPSLYDAKRAMALGPAEPPEGPGVSPAYRAPTRAGGWGAPEGYSTMRAGTEPLRRETAYAQPDYIPGWYEALEAIKPEISPARYEWRAGLYPELLRQWQAGRPISEAEFRTEPYRVEYEAPEVTGEEIETRVKETLPWYGEISPRALTLGEKGSLGATRAELWAEAEEEAMTWAEELLQRRGWEAEELATKEAKAKAKKAAEEREAKWGAWLGAYPYEEEWRRMAPRERGEQAMRYAPWARWRV